MNKIKINHHEFNILPIVIFLTFLIMIMLFAFLYNHVSKETVPLWSLILSIIPIVIGIIAELFDRKITVVKYDDSKIIYKPMFKEIQIKLSDITKAYYTIDKEWKGRGIYNQRIELIIKTENDIFRLNDKIGEEYVTNSLSGKENTPELIKLYNFIADIYPEKAGGYRQEYYSP